MARGSIAGRSSRGGPAGIDSSVDAQLAALGTGLLKTTAGVLSLGVAGVDFESPLTFANGLTRTANAVANDLITGKAGGQTATGGTAASEELRLASTTNATKGKVRSLHNFIIGLDTDTTTPRTFEMVTDSRGVIMSLSEASGVLTIGAGPDLNRIDYSVPVALGNISDYASSTLRIGLNGTGIGVLSNAGAPVAQQARGATLTNNVTAGGTDDTIANFTDLTTYANDAAAIRNDIYQLARALRMHDVAMRAYGWLT